MRLPFLTHREYKRLVSHLPLTQGSHARGAPPSRLAPSCGESLHPGVPSSEFSATPRARSAAECSEHMHARARSAAECSEHMHARGRPSSQALARLGSYAARAWRGRRQSLVVSSTLTLASGETPSQPPKSKMLEPMTVAVWP